MSSFTSSSASNWTPSGSPGSLQHLCSVSQRACELLTPMVQSFYSALNSSTSMLKEDKSVFTIADGTVQHLLVEHLFGPIENTTRFRNIIGEEECTVNLTNKPYTVAGLQIPDLFNEQVEQTRDSIRTLSSLLPAGHELYSTLSVFIDPIDGTREFATGLGEQCSICIGFSDVSGFPVAGVVYRPITTPPTWAAGAKSENYRAGVLQSSADQETATGLLTSNGGISPFLVALMDELKYPRVPSGGAGNKMLMLLEKKGAAYIQDRGVSRWDTCGAQACIEAYGGILFKLAPALQAHSTDEQAALQSYRYLQSDCNLDFIPGLANLTMYNCSSSSGLRKGDPSRPALHVSEVKEYSNLCGLLAVGVEHNHPAGLAAIHRALSAAKERSAPSYD